MLLLETRVDVTENEIETDTEEDTENIALDDIDMDELTEENTLLLKEIDSEALLEAEAKNTELTDTLTVMDTTLV